MPETEVLGRGTDIKESQPSVNSHVSSKIDHPDPVKSQMTATLAETLIAATWEILRQAHLTNCPDSWLNCEITKEKVPVVLSFLSC